MFEGVSTFLKKLFKPGQAIDESSKDTAKERLHLVLMQDRANVSADFLDLMKQEIIDVIKKYIVVDEKEIDVRLTNQSNDDGTNGAPALYANIPIINIKNDVKAEKMSEQNDNSANSTVEQKRETKKVTEKKTTQKRTKKVSSEEISEEKENDLKEQKEDVKIEKSED